MMLPMQMLTTSQQVQDLQQQQQQHHFTNTSTNMLINQHQHQQQQQQADSMTSPIKAKPTKVTKIRRTRQSRNPQLSVARRNERERNRVKMVNNGFAVLRDHLPVEYLAATAEGAANESGSETPDVGAASSSASSSAASNCGGAGADQKSNSNKAKKFSKVETLRAAIQHIRMLEQLIRTSDPSFESIQIQSNTTEESLMFAYDELDGGPLSVGEPPASCQSSTSSSHTSTHTIVHPQSYGQQMGAYEQHPQQFVKLEPQQNHNHHTIQPLPQVTQAHQYQTMTQVHHNLHNHHHQQQHEQPQQLMTGDSPRLEHTNSWIEQTTFDNNNNNNNNGQQQFHHQQQQQQWYIQNNFIQQQQQQQQQLVAEQQLSPVSLDSPASHLQPLPTPTPSQQQQHQIWYAESSPSPQSAQHLAQHQPVSGQTAFNSHQQHQISLYSQ